MKLVKQMMIIASLVLGCAAGSAVWAAPEPGIDAEPLVNINRASADELAEALSGVGHKKAEEIVKERNSGGPFMSAEELSRVKGIGNSTIEKNRDRIQLQ